MDEFSTTAGINTVKKYRVIGQSCILRAIRSQFTMTVYMYVYVKEVWRAYVAWNGNHRRNWWNIIWGSEKRERGKQR